MLFRQPSCETVQLNSNPWILIKDASLILSALFLCATVYGNAHFV